MMLMVVLVVVVMVVVEVQGGLSLPPVEKQGCYLVGGRPSSNINIRLLVNASASYWRYVSQSRKTNGKIAPKILTAHLGEHVPAPRRYSTLAYTTGIKVMANHHQLLRTNIYRKIRSCGTTTNAVRATAGKFLNARNVGQSNLRSLETRKQDSTTASPASKPKFVAQNPGKSRS
ncbi:hypothetical protein M0804_000837 [Polistes exclamans]|nr:hypothetical protein M0804_000837 [Polistes exclamans]